MVKVEFFYTGDEKPSVYSMEEVIRGVKRKGKRPSKAVVVFSYEDVMTSPYGEDAIRKWINTEVKPALGVDGVLITDRRD